MQTHPRTCKLPSLARGPSSNAPGLPPRTHDARRREYLEFIVQIDGIVPSLVQLLCSKTQGDVLESIKLLTLMKKCNLESAELGMKKMLLLIWSQEEIIKEEVLNTYWQVYMQPDKFKEQDISGNLINLLCGTTLSQQHSFEELILSILKKKQFNKKDAPGSRTKIKDISQFFKNIFKFSWDFFLAKYKLIYDSSSGGETERIVTEQQRNEYQLQTRAALQIIRIYCSINNQFMNKRIVNFIGMLSNFINNSNTDWIIVKEICLIIQLTLSQDQ